jgi:CHASE2 domain-containing sensor protein
LKYGLKTAIRHGLQLAIFNSCDGLGLAKALTHLHIPQTIVMREAVPDTIAQKFLHYFLEALVEGTPFYIAVRTARERLHALDRDFPYASWMPAIAQNPAETPLTWKSLLPQPSTKPQNIESRYKYGTVLVASAVIALLTMTARYFGFLQAWELSTLDAFMQLRPVEPQDARILVVTIDEKDVKYQQKEGMTLAEGSPSLSAQALTKLLTKLDRATTIGLDIYHNPKSIQPNFANLLQQNQKLFTVCKVSESDGTHTDSPPRGIPSERQGFSDVVVDADDTIRRQLLRMEDIYPTSKCTTEYALSMHLAAHYLWRTKEITVNLSSEGYLQFGDATLTRWRNHMGGYQKLDDRGYQILLNYRAIFNQEAIAQTISLEQLLSDNFKPETVKDRIVLVGVTDPTIFDDSFYTPFSGNQTAGRQKMPGVTIQAQMVSNLLSTVLEKRLQIQVWSVWAEGIWVWAWAIVGGSLVWWLFSHTLSLGISTVSALGILSGSCFIIFIQGWWLPLVPAVIALLATSGVVFVSIYRQNDIQTPILPHKKS